MFIDHLGIPQNFEGIHSFCKEENLTYAIVSPFAKNKIRIRKIPLPIGGVHSWRAGWYSINKKKHLPITKGAQFI